MPGNMITSTEKYTLKPSLFSIWI